ncbi:Superfamily II DNA and RNA helicase [Oryzisolibacter propanilivorax]|uniref:Superfamily II DNA and RNA helicase n=1 Tax=Oryzisolibacter propanilivorax TaxID=1527607 RepID=A0A1G9TML9_9BURK|nr:DEAD/DEAH box helicase [Oryzisolibacter propanilivorax]SDM48778.1 Superfamily II DNA and RNA helicase [Oryzisolibacter propanilivorax]
MTDQLPVQGHAAPADSSLLSAAADVAVVAPEAVQATETPEAAPVAALPEGFVRLGLAPELVQAVHDLGYTQPTAVQDQAIPLAMGTGTEDGRAIDLMVSSQTGSGKTAAFLLPVLHTLLQQQAEAEAEARAEYERAAAEAAARGEAGPKRAKRKNPTHPRNFKAATPGALVLCPTRELAQQVAHDAIELVKHCKGLRIANVVGGMPYQVQIARLQNANLVVATPGRLLDLQRSMQIKLDQVQFLVVDEADRMLDLGFSDDLAEINELTAARKQTMMFSATFAPRIQQLAMRVMHDGGAGVKKIQIDTPQEKHANIKQMLYWADSAEHKRKLLDHWLRDTGIDQAIVFASTQIECDGLAGELQQAGFSAVALHGALSQGLRNRRLMALRNGQVQILVATDVAARGIDVPTITHVFNYGLPMKAEDYTHRIGRTGRAGRQGLAVTFAEFRDRRRIFDIEGYSRQPFKPEVIAGLEPTQRFPQGGRGDFGGNGRGAGGARGRGGERFGGRGDRGGFGGHGAGNRFGHAGEQQRFDPRFDDQRGAPRQDFDARGARGPAREGFGGGARGHAPHGHGPRRDEGGYGRKGGFGDAPRSDFGRGDFARPAKPAFAKPQGAGRPYAPRGDGAPRRNERPVR